MKPIAVPISISQDSPEPIYHQIETQLRTLIAGGHLPPGAPLPSIRTLAKELSCSVITTRRAYQNLEQAGFIETTQGRGTFVAKIEASQREVYREKAMADAFQEAITMSLQLKRTPEEIRDVFEAELMKLTGQNE